MKAALLPMHCISGQQVRRIAASGGADIRWRDGALMAGKDVLANLENAPALRGAHNGQNAAAATAVLGALGHDMKDLQQALEDFPGLPTACNRLELTKI